MRIVGRGHPAVRATHDKTLELTSNAGISERATCVVGVAADVPAEPMAGPVRLTLSCGGERFVFDARAVSSWQPGASMVFRRSSVRTPTTFAVEATATAADLPRELVAAMGGQDVEVVLEIERRPSPPTLVFAPTGLPAPQLAAEMLAADDEVELSDALAARGPLPAPVGRLLVCTDAPLPRRTGFGPVDAIEAVGLHPSAAAVAAAPWQGPVVVGEPDQVARAAAHQLVVLRCGQDGQLEQLLARAARDRGATHATLAANDFGPVVHTIGDPLPAVPRSAVVWCCLPPVRDDVLDPGVRAALGSLLADGVPTKSVARAAAALTGRPQRELYDVVLGLRGEA